MFTWIMYHAKYPFGYDLDYHTFSELHLRGGILKIPTHKIPNHIAQEMALSWIFNAISKINRLRASKEPCPAQSTKWIFQRRHS